ncbi:hypothetical protein J1N35_035139 [Gossypium stocksii]|uniref:Uncharacterized protein n=1 Tax=Gossypium stocksii TaxID=47602 RepID=A0A9D3UU72_9ROSI|nr:hypothetical protein J1N35_035139 [Gossypium stocksii]
MGVGLPIDKSAVAGVSTISEPTTLCYNLLEVSPDDAKSKFTSSRFSWLKANFEHLSITATKREVMCATRAYTMHIIKGVLILDANNNKPSLEYIQWYSKMGKLYLFGGQLIVVSPHMPRLGQPSFPFLHPPPTPKLEPSPEPELTPNLE